MINRTHPFILALCGIIAAGCNPGHDHDKNNEHKDNREKHADEIVFTHKQAEAAGLKTETVMPADFQFTIHTSGKLMASQGDERTIAATTSGIVTFAKTATTEGTAVKAGETMASISAKTLQDGDPAVKAKAAFETARTELRRAEQLIVDKIISEKDFEQARLNYETARAAYQGVAGKITAKGVSVASPLSGYIKSRLVGNGEYVAVGQAIAVVSQNKRLILMADVQEKDFKYLHDIRSANFKPAYDDTVYSLDSLNGRMISYGKAASANTAFIPVTFEFDNIGNFVSGSYADVYLLSAVRKQAISVPLSAIMEEQGLKFVYIQTGHEIFDKREVTTGRSNGVRVEILKGLKAGDHVVTAGTYQVKMASMSAAIPAHSHNH